jgi:hypothetical protein
MFGNVNGGYSLADLAAVTAPKNEDGFFGGNSAWWIILLFMFAGGWGGGGFFGGGDAGTARDAVSYGFDMNGLENGIRGIQNGLADGFYETNEYQEANTKYFRGYCIDVLTTLHKKDTIKSINKIKRKTK